MEEFYAYVCGFSDWVPDDKSTEFLLAVMEDAVQSYNKEFDTNHDFHEHMEGIFDYWNKENA